MDCFILHSTANIKAGRIMKKEIFCFPTPSLKANTQFTSPNTGGYRYFFNGQEGDNEAFGEVANFGYEFRQYDSRLGRWWSVDPKWNEYPGVSPYVFCNGNPIILMDPNGKTSYEVNGEKKQIDDGRNNITVHDVTQHQFNRLQRSFAKNREKYDRLSEKFKIHNGYTQNTNAWDVSIDNNTTILPSVICSYHKGKPYLSEQIGKGVSTFIRKLDEGGSGDAWDREFAEKAQPYAMGMALINPLFGVPNAFKTIATGEDIYGIQSDKIDKGGAWLNIGFTITELAFPEFEAANLIFNTIGGAFSSYKYSKSNKKEDEEK